MADSQVEMTREELYDKVWTTPIRTLAGEWGLSDVGLAKICQRHEIPRPAQGHWAKKRHGKRIRKTPLPKVSDERLNAITISPTADTDAAAVSVDSEIAELIRLESKPERAIEVKEGLQIRNEFVKATRESLKGMRPNEYGRVIPNRQYSKCSFDVQVSPGSVTRALRILQALASAMKERGHALKAGSGNHHRPHFEVLGEEFELIMRESSKRSERKYEGAERDQWWRARYEYTPTGVIELSVNYRTYASDATLRDTKKKQLEDRLNEVVVAMLKTVDRRRKQAEKARKEAILKAERKKVAVEQEVKRRSDSVRIERLVNLTKSWESHRRLSAFVEAVRSEADMRSPHVDADTVDWLTWADAYLRENDPLCGGENLPTYALTEDELTRLRRECESDWNAWSETFRQR